VKLRILSPRRTSAKFLGLQIKWRSFASLKAVGKFYFSQSGNPGYLSSPTAHFLSFFYFFITFFTSALLTCLCFTTGVNLLTPSGHRQIRDVITTGIDMCGRRMRKGGGGRHHTSAAALTNQLCSDCGVVRVSEYSINVLYCKYGRNQS
jgi:hypothetical protein